MFVSVALQVRGGFSVASVYDIPYCRRLCDITFPCWEGFSSLGVLLFFSGRSPARFLLGAWGSVCSLVAPAIISGCLFAFLLGKSWVLRTSGVERFFHMGKAEHAAGAAYVFSSSSG